MNNRPLALRPHDVCVLLQYTLTPEVPFRELSKLVGLSLGEAHNATKRLEASRLVPNGGGTVNASGSVEFLMSGVPYAFPGILGPEARGVPTAHSGPVLRDEIRSGEMVVWPSAKGDVRGFSLIPLCHNAPETAEKNPSLYGLLTVVDAIRIGRARERELAQAFLREHLSTDVRGRS